MTITLVVGFEKRTIARCKDKQIIGISRMKNLQKRFKSDLTFAISCKKAIQGYKEKGRARKLTPGKAQ